MQKKSIVTLMLSAGLVCISSFISCTKKSTPTTAVAKDINTATKVSVDRFSDAAATLMKRSGNSALPAANMAIDLDKVPFITLGLDKDGAPVYYYNFDVQSTTPDDIYVFFKKDGSAVSGQNNILPTIPGDKGYSDFWIVNKVTVPDNYVANSITSEEEVKSSGYTVVKTTTIVNCPVVPFGSTAKRSKTVNQASVATIGWYKGQAVAYFSFEEAAITATSGGLVPTSPIYVIFNDDAKGPASGFATISATSEQTHNVLATLPNDASYSPLWQVFVIPNAQFGNITNLAQAKAAPSQVAGANVNCPVVK